MPGAGSDALFVQSRLPHTYGMPRLELTAGGDGELVAPKPTLTVGVVFCGRQCPGAHNVAVGLTHFLQRRGGEGAKLLGFLDGTRGLFGGRAVELGADEVAPYLRAIFAGFTVRSK